MSFSDVGARMKSIAKLVLLLFGSLIVLSGCSAVSSMLFGDSKDAASKAPASTVDSSTAVEEAPAPEEEVVRFTFYDSWANW